MKTSIIVRWQFEGFHAYEKAPDEVKFLSTTHRHLFKCSAQIQVHHNDRELEFFIVQRKLKLEFGDGQFNNMSCETIAHKIYQFLFSLYGIRSYKIEVSEDGENSSVVEL